MQAACSADCTYSNFCSGTADLPAGAAVVVRGGQAAAPAACGEKSCVTISSLMRKESMTNELSSFNPMKGVNSRIQ